MKFKDMKNKVTTDKDGFKFIREHSVMVGDNPEKCRMCSESTEFIDICSEAHICSTECQEKLDNEYDEYLKQLPEEMAIYLVFGIGVILAIVSCVSGIAAKRRFDSASERVKRFMRR